MIITRYGNGTKKVHSGQKEMKTCLQLVCVSLNFDVLMQRHALYSGMWKNPKLDRPNKPSYSC